MKKKSLEQRKKIVCDLVSDALYVPMKEKELAIMMQVPPSERAELKNVLDALLMEGKLQITKRGKYIKPEIVETKSQKGDKEELIGTFVSHPKGFGFVEIDGITEDYYVPENKVNGAFHKDTVQIALLPSKSGKRQEAEVVKIIERGIEKIVGTYQKNRKFGFVVPDNQKLAEDIFIPETRSKGAVTGHKVVVEITDYGKNGKKPEGIVKEIIGHENDPGVDIASIVKGFDLPVEFGEKIMNQVDRVPSEVLEADLTGRLDLRDVVMVTIDGEDAKDLDDAVSISREGNCYKLGVHIADVTNYVQENSALDHEALTRGTSVYLVDRVIPMLPHKLSNGICSLNEGVDRLALSCIMTVDQNGTVIDQQIAETVINVNSRMTYTSVAKIIDENDETEMEKYKDLVPMFFEMRDLAKILREKRRKRGSIDFEFQESKIILDKEGNPLEIKAYDRNIATKIIEDFMLLANETVAQQFFWLEMPFVYRTHDNPDPEKIKKLALFINNFGYSMKVAKDEVHPKELQKLLGKIDGTNEEALISRLVLRSMKRAKYETESNGHFGLACQYYCHFTSPIRRYPDLQIHRIIKEYLRGRLKGARVEHYSIILPDVCVQASKMERRAEEAERETDKLKKVQYMEARIGEVFEGVISGITKWGVYVELENTVEGMIHVSALPGDYFAYNEEAYEMLGQSTGIAYKLGQPLKIKVKSVDKIARTIDFAIAEEE